MRNNSVSVFLVIVLISTDTWRRLDRCDDKKQDKDTSLWKSVYEQLSKIYKAETAYIFFFFN